MLRRPKNGMRHLISASIGLLATSFSTIAVAACSRTGLSRNDDAQGQATSRDPASRVNQAGSSASRPSLPGAGKSDDPAIGCSARSTASEVCNGADDDCDSVVDEGLGVGTACDGPDRDLCIDDLLTCDGCSVGSDDVEVCNGRDDDCDGVVDADCEVGECKPSLEVTEVVPSMSTCFVDALQVGSRGQLGYACAGGSVSAAFGPIVATGLVSDGFAELAASTTFAWTDGCTWESTQRIFGTLAAGTLSYEYEESPLAGTNCDAACTALGTIRVVWQ